MIFCALLEQIRDVYGMVWIAIYCNKIVCCLHGLLCHHLSFSVNICNQVCLVKLVAMKGFQGMNP